MANKNTAVTSALPDSDSPSTTLSLPLSTSLKRIVTRPIPNGVTKQSIEKAITAIEHRLAELVEEKDMLLRHHRELKRDLKKWTNQKPSLNT